MANLYIGVSSKARLVKNIYIGVNGKARKVQKAYIGVGGKARLFYSASTPFAFTYTGSYATEGNLEGNFVIRFKTSGTLKITNIGNTGGKLDVFCVGGGSAGNGPETTNMSANNSSGGGGGGYTKTTKSVSISTTSYSIIVGAGGTYIKPTKKNGYQYIDPAVAGNKSSGLGISANGGTNTNKKWKYVDAPCHCGFDGGSGGAAGSTYKTHKAGSNGGNGYEESNGSVRGGTGQGSTTREFGESSGKLYAGGGGCGMYYSFSGGEYDKGAAPRDGGGGCGVGYGWTGSDGRTTYDAQPGIPNTGGGGGGHGYFRSGTGSPGAAGGSGIVCIRNAR